MTTEPLISFEDVYAEVEKSSHETAFNREECYALYDLMTIIPDDSVVVEIGVQYGRSLTVLGMVAKARNDEGCKIKVFGIDNWSEGVSAEAKAHVEEFIKRLELPIEILSLDSKVAAKYWVKNMGINLIHIDGDHTFQGVMRDCKLWLPKVVVGGFAVFDDYREEYTPDVVHAVNEYFNSTKDTKTLWQWIGIAGEKLVQYRKTLIHE